MNSDPDRDRPYWLERAEEVRLVAERMKSPDDKAMMLDIVAGYLRLGIRALEGTSKRPEPENQPRTDLQD